MITVFGHFDEVPSQQCADMSATAGEFGGSVTFTPCDGAPITLNVKANTTRSLGCVDVNSVNASPGVVVNILGPCSGDDGFNDGPIGGGDEGSGTGAGTDRTIIFTNTGKSEIYPIAYTYDMADGTNASQGSPLGAGQSHSKQGTVGYSFNTNIDVTYIAPE